MTLLARGAGLRRMATAGLAKSAELEARENQTAAAIDQAKQAQEMNTLGTGAGFGAMYGMKGLAASKAAASAGGTAGQAVLSAAPEAASIAGDTAMLLTDGKLAAMGGETLVTTTSAGVGTAGATGGAAAGATGGVAAGGGGAMAALSTIAAPVAIGLGVAYLLNKLFD